MNGEHQHPDGESSDKCPDMSVLLESFSNDSLQSAQPPGDRLSNESLEHHIEACAKCQAILQEMVIRERQTLAPLLDIQTGPENLAAGEPTAGLNREIPGFRIDRKLGHGGGAVVYLAEDLTTSRMVAIKLIENEPETNAEKRDQWLDEVRLAARIEHQNVVRLYHVEESSDYFLLVFEYVAGGTLHDWKDLPATTHQIAQLISTIALAVHQIHQLGILHLDLKPSNILIDTSAGESWDTIQPKVSDFGISSWHRPNEIEATRRSFGRGTPSYMAPEQIFGDPALLSPATDVYGLGGLLFTLLTGSPPFAGSSSTQIVRQVIESPATVLEDQTRPLPDGLREITLRCLQKHPEHRYCTTKELADELTEWIRQQQSRPGSRSTFHRFSPAAVLSIAVMCLIAFLRTAGSNWFSDLQPTPAQNTPAVESPTVTSPTVTSPTVQSTETVMSVTEWVDLISRDPAAFDSDSAATLVAATRFHTNDVLSRSPVSFELCLRYGMLQERAVERFVASLNKQHFALGAELLAESIRLLEKAVELKPNDQSAISELVAAYFIDSQQRESDDVTNADIRFNRTARSARILSHTAPYVIRMEDSKQRVLWIARILDHFRLNIWNFRWRGELETVRELEQQKLDFWNQLGPLQQQPELAWRHALTKLPSDNSAWPDVPGDGWLLENDRTPFLQELLFTFVAQTMWEAAALNKVRSADKQPVQSGQTMLVRILQFMRTRGMDQNMLPNVIHYDLVRPLSGIGTDLRRESRLDEADALQKAYLRLGMACRTQFPDDADILLAISEAYLQAWKNNLRRDDAAAAVDALKLSLDAAKTATLVAPDSARARFQVADRIKRLTRFRPTESFSQKN